MDESKEIMRSIEIEPGIRTSTLAPNGQFIDYTYEDCTTAHEAFMRGKRLAGDDGKCFGYKKNTESEYTWLSYQQVFDKASVIGSGLVHIGIKPSEDACIGIYSANCLNWCLVDRACHMFSMVPVPIYNTFGHEACLFCIEQTEMKVIFCDTADKVGKIIEDKNKLTFLKYVVAFEPISGDLIKKAADVGIVVYSFEEFGLLEPVLELIPPKPEDMFTICFTSGTTGTPKGVILTHKAAILNINAIMLTSGMKINTSTTHLGYLPLAHMIERLTQVMLFVEGAHIGIFTGDPKSLIEELSIVQPNFFISVPRVLNRIYDKIKMNVNASYLKSILFEIALNQKKKMLKEGVVTNDSIWDKLVFGKVRALLGGNVDMIITGSAALSAEVIEFLTCVMGCPVREAYGQTENCAAITFVEYSDFTAGHVGPPMPINLIKLVDVPEMDYYADKNGGEVCYKGPCSTPGYFKNEKETKALIDEDGWHHSGDIGVWLPSGVLKIIDRKKNIFKLSQGEYLAPEKIENVYSQSQYVQQICVDGKSDQSYPVAIVVPDFEVLSLWATNNKLPFDNMEDLCKLADVKETILASMNEVATKNELKGFEKVKKIHLLTELFSIENELLTPTFKLRRINVKKRYNSVISEMYID